MSGSGRTAVSDEVVSVIDTDAAMPAALVRAEATGLWRAANTAVYPSRVMV